MTLLLLLQEAWLQALIWDIRNHAVMWCMAILKSICNAIDMLFACCTETRQSVNSSQPLLHNKSVLSWITSLSNVMYFKLCQEVTLSFEVYHCRNLYKLVLRTLVTAKLVIQLLITAGSTWLVYLQLMSFLYPDFTFCTGPVQMVNLRAVLLDHFVNLNIPEYFLNPAHFFYLLRSLVFLWLGRGRMWTYVCALFQRAIYWYLQVAPVCNMEKKKLVASNSLLS